MPFPAGGGTDLLARLVAEALVEKWGQTVYVENLSGAASGNVGALEVARSTPDGHTLLLSPPGPIAMNRLLYKTMPFNSSKWVPISVIASVPYVLAIRNGLGVADVKGLIAKAKAEPDKLTYASPGAGTVGHLAAKQFEMLAGVQFNDHAVSRPGAGAERHRGRARRSDLRHDHDVAAAAQWQAGEDHRDRRVGALAELPDVPTIAETGLPGFRAVTWYAIVAPPETPAEIADKISRDVTDIVNDPAVARRSATSCRWIRSATPASKRDSFRGRRQAVGDGDQGSKRDDRVMQ